jgi:hypothetical protein
VFLGDIVLAPLWESAIDFKGADQAGIKTYQAPDLWFTK